MSGPSTGYRAQMGALLPLAAVHLVGLVVPGPNVLAVSQTAAGGSRRAGLAVALGVAAAALLWAATAAAGLALLLTAVGGLSTLVRAAGATVLVVLGIRMIAHRDSAAVAGVGADGGRLARFFGKGLLVNLSNPKSLVYYTSVFTALVPAAAPPAVRLAAVVLVVGESVVWHSLLALFFSRERPRRLYARLGARIERGVGGVFVLFGARLLWGATR